jgi:LemA protein
MSAWIAVALTVACLAAAYVMYRHYRLALAHREVLFSYGRMEDLLKRKLDLIPAVVSALKTYLSHERDTIDCVMRARRLTVDARISIKEQGADGMALAELSLHHQTLNQATWDLLMLISDYPAIHMDQKLGGLLSELRELEPLVRSTMVDYNHKVQAAQQERLAPMAALVAKLGHFAQVFPCDPSSVDLAMVKFAVATAVPTETVELLPAAPLEDGRPTKLLADNLVASV